MRATSPASTAALLDFLSPKVAAELPVREVLVGAYRLLRALAGGFKVTQMALQ